MVVQTKLTTKYVKSLVKLGMTREEVIKILGEPHSVTEPITGCNKPFSFVYDETELIFYPWNDGRLYRISPLDPILPKIDNNAMKEKEEEKIAEMINFVKND